MTDASPILSRLPPTDPPPDLALRALLGLRRFRVRRLKRALALVALGFVVSGAYAVWAWPALREEVAGSSFVALAHLAVSDPDVVAAALGDFTLGLLESLPLAALLLASLVLFLLLGAAAALLKIRIVRRPPSLGRPSAAH